MSKLTVKVRKLGKDSIGITIPVKVLELLEIAAGDVMSLNIDRGDIILTLMRDG